MHDSIIYYISYPERKVKMRIDKSSSAQHLPDQSGSIIYDFPKVAKTFPDKAK